MSIFSGLSAFPITPATPEGRVIEADLRGILKRIAVGGADSVGLLGSTGTYMFLDRDERRRATAIAVETLTDTPVIVGVGALRTDHAQALAKDAAGEGAAGLLLAPVSYTPLADEEVFRHFAAVAEATDTPIVIYNNPSTTNFTFKPGLVARLADAIPSIAAIKLPLPKDDIAEDLKRYRAAAPRLAIGYSGDWGCKDGLLAGADAWFNVAGGMFTQRAAALTAAARRGDRAEADRLDADFAPLWEVFKAAGGMRAMYAAANHLGLTAAQPPLPILPLEGELRARLVAAVAGL
jgi:4-hydroxy-tetrahydrodipicolinate synthase